jgi:hypothetical protein
MYNNAQILVETNDMGEQVANTLFHDLEYEEVLFIAPPSRGATKKSEIGVRTTKSVKALGCSTLDDMIRGDKLIVQDEDTILELSGFVKKGYSYEADVGYTDDLVMGLVLFAWLTTQPIFRDMTDQDIRKRLFERQMIEIEEDLVPFGFIDDGLSNIQGNNEAIDISEKYWSI